MQTTEPRQAAPSSGRHYPRKMRTGWCVAHRITGMGATIERYGAKYRTYPEAFEAAERMNRQEAAAASPAPPSAADAASGDSATHRQANGKEVQP